MNNPQYSDYLECQLTGFYDRETPPMADDPQSFEGSDEEEFSCPLCGCNVAAWAGRLGNLMHFNCRNCGHTSYQEVE
jgi:hypothetical protein